MNSVELFGEVKRVDEFDDLFETIDLLVEEPFIFEPLDDKDKIIVKVVRRSMKGYFIKLGVEVGSEILLRGHLSTLDGNLVVVAETLKVIRYKRK